MNYETLSTLFSSAIDILYESFGAEWVIVWGIDNGLTDEQITSWLVEDVELIDKLRRRG